MVLQDIDIDHGPSLAVACTYVAATAAGHILAVSLAGLVGFVRVSAAREAHALFVRDAARRIRQAIHDFDAKQTQA